MSDPTVAPAFLLTDYAWKLLQANMGETWSPDKYGGMRPIVPLAEEPELSQFSGPHIIYGYAQGTSGNMYMERAGTITFTIRDTSSRRMAKTLNILQTGFGRLDDSARDINAYTSTKEPFLGIRFGTVRVSYLQSEDPEEAEGGRQTAVLAVSFTFFDEWDSSVITSFA